MAAVRGCGKASGSQSGNGVTTRRRWSPTFATRCRTRMPRPSSTPKRGLSPSSRSGAAARASSGSTGRRRASAARGLADEALAAEIEERSASILGEIAIDGPRQVFPLAGMNAQALAGGRAVLVGEAAHLFPPIGAQGLNLGYRDVARSGQDSARAGRRSRQRRAACALTIARGGRTSCRGPMAIDALNRTLLTDFIPMQGLRGLGLFLLDRIAPLRRAVMRQGVSAVSEADQAEAGRGRRASRRP